MSDYGISPNEKYVSLTIHGEIFVKALGKDRPNTNNISNHAYKDHNGTWLNDSTILMSSDRDGQEDLYKMTSSDTSFSNLYKSYKFEINHILEDKDDQSQFILSHKRDKILILSSRGKLSVANIDSSGHLDSMNTLLDGWATPNGLS